MYKREKRSQQERRYLKLNDNTVKSDYITQNLQRDFTRVKSRSFLHFTLIRSRVRACELGDGEGGVALRGVVHSKIHPLHEHGVTHNIFLSTWVQQELTDKMPEHQIIETSTLK